MVYFKKKLATHECTFYKKSKNVFELNFHMNRRFLLEVFYCDVAAKDDATEFQQWIISNLGFENVSIGFDAFKQVLKEQLFQFQLYKFSS